MEIQKIMPIFRLIRLVLGFSRWSDGDIQTQGYHVYESMSGNPLFPKPPISLEDFKALLDAFRDAIAEAQFGDIRAISQRNKYRDEVIRSLRALGHYVEHTAGDDMAGATSSGFKIQRTYFSTTPTPLSTPGMMTIEQGLSGELRAKSKSLGRDARLYELRCGARNGDEFPTDWLTKTVTSVKSATSFRGLTPGTIYLFQVRALGRAGYTDWSDPVSRMCI
jgi:hypothetical protein